MLFVNRFVEKDRRMEVVLVEQDVFETIDSIVLRLIVFQEVL